MEKGVFGTSALPARREGGLGDKQLPRRVAAPLQSVAARTRGGGAPEAATRREA